MKYKTILSLFLAFLLCIAPIISFAAGTPPKDGAYGQGTRTDPVRYLDFHSYLERTNNIAAPTAIFSIVKGQDEYSTDEYEGQTINMYLGDTISIKELSTASSGNTVNAWDFQMTEGGSLILQKTNKADINGMSYKFTKEGYYNFYLSVRDSEDNEASGYWGNWSTNGSHKALGLNPGKNGIKETVGYPEVASGDDLWGDWYFTYIQVHVISNPIKADFDIIYKGSVVTSTVTKDTNNLALTLRDKSSVTDPKDPITQRLWYYWNIQSGWELLDTGDNDSTVVIDNMDTDLTGSQALKKAFKLEVYTDSGSTGNISKEATFKQDTGTLTVYYKDLATQEDLYEPDIFVNLSFGTYTKNAKPAPKNYVQVPPTVKSVALSSTTPNAEIYFYYSKQTAGIIVYYKNVYTNASLYDPDTFEYPFGTYQVDAREAPPNYVLDSSTPSPVTVTLDAATPFVEVVFKYKPNGVAANKPPQAVAKAPNPVYAGDEFSITGSASFDPDGTIVRYEWYIGNAEVAAGGGLRIESDGSITGANGKIWYPEEQGWATVTLTVTDNDGATDSDSIKIQVLPPKITLKLDTVGILKQNRKITMSVKNSSVIPKHFTFIDPEIQFTLTPIGGLLDDIKYHGELIGDSKPILSKKPMQLKIEASAVIELKDGEYRKMLIEEGLTEYMPRYTETVEKTITIVPDQPPRAMLAVPGEIIREPNDSNYGTFRVTNTSTSPDGDLIGKSACLATYDSNNNGNFDEEICYYSIDGTSWLSTGRTLAQIKQSGFNIRGLTIINTINYIYKTKEVGDYRFDFIVVEAIPDNETMIEFLIDTDYLIDATFN